MRRTRVALDLKSEVFQRCKLRIGRTTEMDCRTKEGGA
jgi:hypothetical protein